MAQAHGIALADVVDVAKVAGRLDGLELGGVALGLKGGFQRGNAVEVVLQRALVASGDHQDVVQADVDGFLHDVLDGGLVHDRKHFLRHGLGGGKEPGAEAGCGNDGLADGSVECSHSTNLTEGPNIAVIIRQPAGRDPPRPGCNRRRDEAAWRRKKRSGPGTGPGVPH